MFPVQNSLAHDLKLLFSRYLLLVGLCFFISIFLTPLIWLEGSFFNHTILELACVFIAFFGFGIMWLTYDRHPTANHFIGYGLLAAALCDIIHTYTFPNAHIYLEQRGNFDLTFWYWLLGKYLLTLSLLLGTVNKQLKITRWRGVITSTILSSLLIYIVYLTRNMAPPLLTEQGSTIQRILLFFILVVLLLVLLFRLRSKLNDQDIPMYRYSYFAALLALSGELCLTYSDIRSLYAATGLIQKFFSYYYLCKGIIYSGIIQPFNHLEEKQDSYSQILEHIPLGIIKFNKNLVITFANKIALELLGCEPNDILGLNHIQAADLFSHDVQLNYRGKNYKPLESFWPSGNCTVEIINLQGSLIKVSLIPYKFNEGYISVINDVRVEQEIDSLQEKQQLQQNKRLILLGQMAAGIVHEIRNPLTAVKGFSQIISHLSKDEKIKECSRLIDQETDSLNRVLTDFLRFSRPRNPIMKETELNQLVSSLEMLIESNAFLKKVNIFFDYTKEDTRVLVDSEQIKQVVLNLVQNSIDATGDVPNAWITITTGSNKNINEVYISVSDNGVGMTAEDIMKVGSPFYTTKDKGTGLGLNMCFQIINEHGGNINIESKPNKGTTVTIYLPRPVRTCQKAVNISA